MSMLQVEPDKRPSEAELLLRIAEWPAEHAVVQAEPAAAICDTQADELVGRDAPLERLSALLERTPATPEVVWLSGGPGLGKSALLRHFARAARSEPRVAVIAGRCYQQESIPYKAFDELIDAYTRFLAQLGDDQAARMAPSNLAYAARLFPVLLASRALREPPRRPPSPRAKTNSRNGAGLLRGSRTCSLASRSSSAWCW